jgi:PAS domain S-box-containing protein
MRTEAREPREHLEAFERTKDGVFAVDEDERIVFWNDAARRILGYRRDEVLGRKCYDVIGRDDCEHTDCGPNCLVLQRARRGSSTESYDVMARTAAGSHRLLNVSIIVLKGESARSTLAVHLFRDISEARRSQLEVQRGLLEASQAAGQQDDDDDPAGRLTPRELEVLRLLATGLGNAKIAEVMGISATTVRNHIDHVLTKLGVHSKLEAVVYAARHRIV